MIIFESLNKTREFSKLIKRTSKRIKNYKLYIFKQVISCFVIHRKSNFLVKKYSLFCTKKSVVDTNLQI